MFLGVTWAVTAAMVGFTLGRLSMYGKKEPEEVWAETEGGEVDRIPETQKDGAVATDGSPAQESGKTKKRGRPGRGSKAVEERKTWSVGSPVSGEVTANGEEGRTAVVIRPREDRLYAPAGGKITRLFPMGNAFLFTTEFGAELYIQAGDVGDELLARYYRPRILQNEVVGKGKLLLEFDRQGLEAEGASADVSVCVENCCYGGDVQTTAARWVDAGEEILQVREPCSRPKY